MKKTVEERLAELAGRIRELEAEVLALRDEDGLMGHQRYSLDTVAQSLDLAAYRLSLHVPAGAVPASAREASHA